MYHFQDRLIYYERDLIYIYMIYIEDTKFWRLIGNSLTDDGT